MEAPVILWRRRESNLADGRSIESGPPRTSEGSSEESGAYAAEGGESMSIESGRMPSSCSNVARRVREALAALDAGRVDIAKQRLAELLDVVPGRT
jgi:hypothetical protein